MNKKIFKVTTLYDSDDRYFWAKKTCLERLEALEKLRRIMFGYDPFTERLQRTLTVTQLKADLRKNKRASGRHKDLDDLEHLE